MKNTKNTKNNNCKIAPVCVPAILLIVLITLIRTVDIAPIGPEGTSVGLATINGGFHSLTGLNLTWLNISKYLGYLSFLVPAVMIVVGLVQLIKRKSIKKVDSWLLCLGGLYVLTAVVYALFEVIIINYRPEILPDEDHIEASFPSTHSMLAVVILGSLIAVLPILIDKIKTCRALQICLGILMAAIVIGRLLSGAHWLTDVLGGVIMGALMLGLFGIGVNHMSTELNCRSVE